MEKCNSKIIDFWGEILWGVFIKEKILYNQKIRMKGDLFI